MPISMGKNSTPTNNGIYIVGDRFADMVMDSSTYGVPVELAQRLPHRGRLRHADVLQRDLRARGALVGGQPGLQQRQPRLHQREHQQRAVVLRQHQARRRRPDRQHGRLALPGTDGLGDWNIPWDQWKAGNANI